MPLHPPRFPARPSRLALAGCLAASLTAVLPAIAQAPVRPAEGAQEAAPDPAPQADPQSLIEQGATLLFRGILSELAPEIEGLTGDMDDAMAALGPALGDLSRLVDDIGNYELPERLENGDILIRRKADAPPPPPLGEGLQRLWPKDDPPPPVAPDEDAPQVDL